MLDVALDDTTILMSSSWGLSTGFYLVIISAIVAMVAGVLDFIKEKSGRLSLKNFFRKI